MRTTFGALVLVLVLAGCGGDPSDSAEVTDSAPVSAISAAQLDLECEVFQPSLSVWPGPQTVEFEARATNSLSERSEFWFGVDVYYTPTQQVIDRFQRAIDNGHKYDGDIQRDVEELIDGEGLAGERLWRGSDDIMRSKSVPPGQTASAEGSLKLFVPIDLDTDWREQIECEIYSVEASTSDGRLTISLEGYTPTTTTLPPTTTRRPAGALPIYVTPYASLQEGDLSGMDLSFANLTGAHLDKADLTGTDLKYAWLTEAHLPEADLKYADLTGADLTGAELTFADLTDADLTGADLTGADLAFANLTGANLTNANLTNAYLPFANLHTADLTGAALSGADLGEADLTFAHLPDADLTDVNLTGADLTFAYLVGAIGLD